MTNGKFIAYHWVSTQKQGLSGLDPTANQKRDI
jgi:hypothetical protein